MTVLLGFSPFIAFASVEKPAGTTVGLVAGVLLSFALLIRDRLRGGREVKVLELGTAVLFTVLAAWAAVERPEAWSRSVGCVCASMAGCC